MDVGRYWSNYFNRLKLIPYLTTIYSTSSTVAPYRCPECGMKHLELDAAIHCEHPIRTPARPPASEGADV